MYMCVCVDECSWMPLDVIVECCLRLKELNSGGLIVKRSGAVSCDRGTRGAEPGAPMTMMRMRSFLLVLLRIVHRDGERH